MWLGVEGKAGFSRVVTHIIVVIILITVSLIDHIPTIKWTKLPLETIVIKLNILPELNRPHQRIWKPLLYLTKTTLITIDIDILFLYISIFVKKAFLRVIFIFITTLSLKLKPELIVIILFKHPLLLSM